MQTNYNNIAEKFNAYKSQKTTENIWYNALIDHYIWECKGKKILDYGCWAGQILEILQAKGAEIVGVDISDELIKIASDRLPEAELKVIDTQNPFKNFKKDLFDIISMNYVLCVLPDPEEIQKIIHWAYQALKTWGKLFIQNANRDKANWVDFKSYTLHFKNNLQDGDKIFCTLKLDTLLEIEDYFFSQETYKKRLLNSGFQNVEIHELIWDQEEWWTGNESKISPCYIIEAIK